jgi:hypothetical protein
MKTINVTLAAAALVTVAADASTAPAPASSPAPKAKISRELRALRRKLEDAPTSEPAVAAIQEIAATQDPDAIGILCRWLDVPGPTGLAAVEGLISFGVFAEEAVRRVVRVSMDEDQIRNAHRVLAALGDESSKRAVKAWCWADLEEQDAQETTR